MTRRSKAGQVPESQKARNAAFLEAVRGMRTEEARALAHAPMPKDATREERKRWKTRRGIYPKVEAETEAPDGGGETG